jgi:hypothetical protein
MTDAAADFQTSTRLHKIEIEEEEIIGKHCIRKLFQLLKMVCVCVCVCRIHSIFNSFIFLLF